MTPLPSFDLYDVLREQVRVRPRNPWEGDVHVRVYASDLHVRVEIDNVHRGDIRGFRFEKVDVSVFDLLHASGAERMRVLYEALDLAIRKMYPEPAPVFRIGLRAPKRLQRRVA